MHVLLRVPWTPTYLAPWSATAFWTKLELLQTRKKDQRKGCLRSEKNLHQMMLGPLPDSTADGGPGIDILAMCTPEEEEAELMPVMEERAGLGALDTRVPRMRRGRLVGRNWMCWHIPHVTSSRLCNLDLISSPSVRMMDLISSNMGMTSSFTKRRVMSTTSGEL